MLLFIKKLLKFPWSIDIILNFCYFHKTIGNISIFALVAQLAEHIHGKDKVISSILIEGSPIIKKQSFLIIGGGVLLRKTPEIFMIHGGVLLRKTPDNF